MLRKTFGTLAKKPIITEAEVSSLLIKKRDVLAKIAKHHDLPMKSGKLIQNSQRVFAYNKYMYEACKSFDGISFWCHRGIRADWPQYLRDGVPFNVEQNRTYYNNIRGGGRSSLLMIR